MMAQPTPKTLRLQRLTAEHDRLKPELAALLAAQRIHGLQRIKRRRRPAQDTDLLCGQQIMEVLRRAGHRLRHHHQPPTPQQRTPDLPHRKVERQRVTLRPHPRSRHLIVQRPQQRGDIAVRDRHPLRDTGGPRGVNEVGDIVGARRRQCDAGSTRHHAVIHIDDRQAMPIQPGRQISGADRGDRAGVGKHEPDPLRRRRRIDRQIRRPGLEHRQNRRDRLRRTVKQQRHTPPRARTSSGQPLRQPISSLIEFRIRHRVALKGHRHRLGHARHLRIPQHRNRHRRRRRPGSTPPDYPSHQAGACSSGSNRSNDDNRRCGSAVIATNTRSNRSTSTPIPASSNTFMSYSTRIPSSWPGRAWSGQRVVVGFAAGDIGDGHFVIA